MVYCSYVRPSLRLLWFLIPVMMTAAASLKQNAINELQAIVGYKVSVDSVTEIVNKFQANAISDMTQDQFDLFERSIITPLKNLKIALLVIDYQHDFISGSLSIKTGDAGEDPLEALPSINRLVEHPQLDMVVYTQDWHPSNHISFYEHARNSDRVLSADDKIRKLRPFDIVRFEKPDVIQVLYPSHCVQGSWGAMLHPDMKLVDHAKFVRKGKEVLVDSYSAFGDNNGKRNSELDAVLRKDGITAVLGCGLAYDICVLHTLKDATNIGFLSAVINDCSKGLSTDKIREANQIFNDKNIARLTEEEAQEIIDRQYVPIEWVRALANRAKHVLH